MQSQISEISPVLVEVSVEIPWDRVEKALEVRFSQLARTAKVKGFRPGKVPRSVLKQTFGARVQQEVIQNLVEAGLGHAVEEHRLAVVAVPPLGDTVGIRHGESFAFKAKVEIRPKIETVDTSGISLKRGSSDVPESEVDEAIERLRQSNAELGVPDPMRPSIETDILVCDYSVTIDGTPRPELTATDRAIDLNGALLPELKSALLGKRPGDHVQANVNFTAEQGPEVAGKSGTFDLEIKELKEKILPNVDDEFAKDLNHASLEELRLKTRARLEESAKQRVEADMHKQLIDQLVEKNPIDVPPSLVSQEKQILLREYLRMVRSGRRLPDEMLKNAEAEAEHRVRVALLLGALARILELKIDPGAMDELFEEMANRTGKHIAKVRAEIQGERREALESRILEEKLLEYLLGQATIHSAIA